MSERYLNSYFYKKLKSYEMCNGSKSKVCFNIVVGSRNYGRIAQVLGKDATRKNIFTLKVFEMMPHGALKL